jgi:hypothetical protein
MALRRLACAAILSGLWLSAAALPAAAQTDPIYVQFGDAKAALYRPDASRNLPEPDVGVLVIQPTNNSMRHVACRELSMRGYVVLCMNSRFENRETFVRSEGVAADIKQGIDFLKRVKGLAKVVLFGYGSGGASVSFYQAVAEKGPDYCRAPERILACDGKDLAGLPAADGLILADADPGAPIQSLRSANPAVMDESRPDRVLPGLSPYETRNGFNAKGASTYSAEFKRRYFRAQADRSERFLEMALAEAERIKEGNGLFPDDSVVVMPRATGALLMSFDATIARATAKPHRLLKNDGSIEDCCVIETVRAANPSSADNNATFATGTRVLSLVTYLSEYAIRAGDSMDMEKVEVCSTSNSVLCALPEIETPTLVSAMTGYYLLRDSERFFEASGAADKEFIAVEGAGHGLGPCAACEKNRGQYGNALKNYFDFVAAWIEKRF